MLELERRPRRRAPVGAPLAAPATAHGVPLPLLLALLLMHQLAGAYIAVIIYSIVTFIALDIVTAIGFSGVILGYLLAGRLVAAARQIALQVGRLLQYSSVLALACMCCLPLAAGGNGAAAGASGVAGAVYSIAAAAGVAIGTQLSAGAGAPGAPAAIAIPNYVSPSVRKRQRGDAPFARSGAPCAVRCCACDVRAYRVFMLDSHCRHSNIAHSAYSNRGTSADDAIVL